MQLRSHADTQTVNRSQRWKNYAIIYRIKFGMLQVRENEAALRKLSVSAAQLRTLEGILFFSSWLSSRKG